MHYYRLPLVLMVVTYVQQRACHLTILSVQFIAINSILGVGQPSPLFFKAQTETLHPLRKHLTPLPQSLAPMLFSFLSQ